MKEVRTLVLQLIFIHNFAQSSEPAVKRTHDDRVQPELLYGVAEPSVNTVISHRVLEKYGVECRPRTVQNNVARDVAYGIVMSPREVESGSISLLTKSSVDRSTEFLDSKDLAFGTPTARLVGGGDYQLNLAEYLGEDEEDEEENK